ncbi:MAG TPA: hypothetical protein VGH78_04660 [Solirubrobacteraceae bacterium]|jgi:hypothetical protein
MPRIIVTTTTAEQPREGAVLLDELVHSVHLSTGHAAAQLVERLAWAISDAEEAERAKVGEGAKVGRSGPQAPAAQRRGHERPHREAAPAIAA